MGPRHREIVPVCENIDPDRPGGYRDYSPALNNFFGLGEGRTLGDSCSGAEIFFDALRGKRYERYHIPHLVKRGVGVGQGYSDKALELYFLKERDSDIVLYTKRSSPGFSRNIRVFARICFGKNLLRHRRSGVSTKGGDFIFFSPR